MTSHQPNGDRAAQTRGWEAYCAAARALAGNSTEITESSTTKKDTRDVSRS